MVVDCACVCARVCLCLLVRLNVCSSVSSLFFHVRVVVRFSVCLALGDCMRVCVSCLCLGVNVLSVWVSSCVDVCVCLVCVCLYLCVGVVGGC